MQARKGFVGQEEVLYSKRCGLGRGHARRRSRSQKGTHNVVRGFLLRRGLVRGLAS